MRKVAALPALTEREEQLLALAHQGLTDEMIASRWGVQASTVARHWSRLRRKLGVPDQTAALAFFTTLKDRSGLPTTETPSSQKSDIGEPSVLSSQISFTENEARATEPSPKYSQAPFERIFDCMLEGCQILDFNWMYTYVNDAAAVQARRNKDELLNRQLTDVYVNIKHTPLFAVLQECMTQRVSRKYENEFIYNGGTRAWFLLNIQPIPEGLLILSLDITKQRKTELDLRDKNAGLSRMLDVVPDVIFLKNVHGTYLSCNAAFANRIGLRHNEIIGKTDYDLFPPDTAQAFIENDRLAIESGKPQRAEEFVRCFDGSHSVTDTLIAPLRDSQDKVVGLVGISRDITERKRSEKLQADIEHIFEMIAQKAPLNKTIDRLVIAMESHCEGIRCAVMLSEPGGKRLRLCSAPNLPISTRKAIDSIDIGPTSGSSGTAAYNGRPVVVEDAIKDPYWLDFVDDTGAFQIRACWSSPIFDSEKNLQGVITIYSQEPSLPKTLQQHLIEAIIHTASICIASSRMDADLRESESRYRTLFETMAQGVTYHIPNGEIVYANPAAMRILGSDLAHINDKTRGNDRSRMVFEDGSPVTIDNSPVRRCFETGLPVNGVVLGIPSKGSNRIRWIQADAIPEFRNKQRTPFRVFSTLIDVTEQKSALDALRTSEQKFRTLIEGAPDPIFVETDFRFAFVNLATVELLGAKNAEELLNQSAFDRLAPEYREDLESNIQRVATPRQRCECLLPDGTRKQVEVRTIPVVYDGQPGAVVFARDITEQVQAERELKAIQDNLERRVVERTTQLEIANKELESFSYSVSHDLRAPLRRIDGLSRILYEDYSARLDEEGQLILNRISAASTEMSELIVGMLELSRVNRAAINAQTVNLSKAVEDIIRKFHEQTPNRNVKLSVESDIVVMGDTRLLNVMMENLLGNAWKYTGKRDLGHIQFGKKTEDGQTVYFVKDNGVGFDMLQVERLFNPFQRLHSEQEFPGTGVGLATVKRIIQRHGGQIWAEAEVDKGATFYFTLGSL
jgi:PAS domain S-box-containing protein